MNDSPFAINDNLDVVENGVQTLDVLVNDYDLDPGDSLQVVSASIMNGLGNISTSGNSITFDPGTNYDYLSVGESATVKISYTISDTGGLQSTATAMLTIHGNRDALLLNAPSISSIEDHTIFWNISTIAVDLQG